MRKALIIIGFLIAALFTFSAHGETVSVGFSGKVLSVPVDRSFSATVIVAYGTSGTQSGVVFLPPGTRVTVTVPETVSPVDQKGQAVDLSQVKVGWAFNAIGSFDTVSKVFTPTTLKFFTVAQLDPACMKGASTNRDNALIAALDAYYPAIKQALETRRDALAAARDIQDVKVRRTAIRNAWSAYSSAARQARSQFVSAKKTAWQTFETAKKACRATTADAGANSTVDNVL